VLGQIASALGEREISIASVIQREDDEEGAAEVVIMTHDAREAAMREALGALDALPSVLAISQMLRVNA
jgi:homoserine dehydrogenase